MMAHGEMTEAGAIYSGRVRHRRISPREHTFTQSVFYFFLDLERVEEAMQTSAFLGYETFAHSSFRRADFHGDPRQDLVEAVRDTVQKETGRRPAGKVFFLTELRTLGYAFNPVSFYYCWNQKGDALEAIVAEITNTPWGERHSYVLDVAAATGATGAAGATSSGLHRWRFRKEFHISPFSPMELEHDWIFRTPGRSLSVQMSNRRAEAGMEFDATLLLKRTPLTAAEIRRALRHHPWLPVETIAGIYWNAFRLWWKGARFHSHPDTPPEKV
jgi:DUF1365 family protein